MPRPSAPPLSRPHPTRLRPRPGKAHSRPRPHASLEEAGWSRVPPGFPGRCSQRGGRDPGPGAGPAQLLEPRVLPLPTALSSQTARNRVGLWASPSSGPRVEGSGAACWPACSPGVWGGGLGSAPGPGTRAGREARSPTGMWGGVAFPGRSLALQVDPKVRVMSEAPKRRNGGTGGTDGVD